MASAAPSLGSVPAASSSKSTRESVSYTHLDVYKRQELTYKGDPVTIASLPGMKERTILINGFSKAYAMTGWRLGYACGPKEIISQMVKIHQFAIMCAPTTSQYAAVEALKNGDAAVEEMRTAYNQRRRYLMHAFEEMGLECFEPYGAFYVLSLIHI